MPTERAWEILKEENRKLLKRLCADILQDIEKKYTESEGEE